jgi:hypothetical protein
MANKLSLQQVLKQNLLDDYNFRINLCDSTTKVIMTDPYMLICCGIHIDAETFKKNPYCHICGVELIIRETIIADNTIRQLLNRFQQEIFLAVMQDVMQDLNQKFGPKLQEVFISTGLNDPVFRDIIIDPITGVIITDPYLISCCGFTIDKTTINKQNCCHICRKPFISEINIVPNKNVKMLLDRFKKEVFLAVIQDLNQ